MWTSRLWRSERIVVSVVSAATVTKPTAANAAFDKVGAHVFYQCYAIHTRYACNLADNEGICQGTVQQASLIKQSRVPLDTCTPDPVSYFTSNFLPLLTHTIFSTAKSSVELHLYVCRQQSTFFLQTDVSRIPRLRRKHSEETVSRRILHPNCLQTLFRNVQNTSRVK